MYLHSANSSQSYIPQQILDQKAEELRKRKEISDQINVSPILILTLTQRQWCIHPLHIA